MIEGKRCLVTGGGGSVGSELVRQLHKDNEVYILDINETAFFDLAEELGVDGRVGDIRDGDLVHGVFRDFQPHIVFHAAALKHVVPSMQTPREYVKTNLLGTLNVLEAARDWEAKRVINISTDKATSCDNVMGWSKKGTELFTRICGGVSVRFGNVLGSRGSVIPVWQHAVDRGQPIKVTDERMRRYFMTIEEACGLVIEAAEKGEPGDIYILKMGESVRIIDIAKRIIAESRKSIPIEMVGIRPGEKLEEILMSENEQENAIETEKFYILKGN